MITHLKKILSFSIGSILGIIISVISLPIITRMVSPEEYGYVNVFLGIAAVFSAIGLGGFDQAFIRFFNKTNPKKLMIFCFLSSSILLVFSSVLLLLLDSYISNLIGKNSSYFLLMILYIGGIIIFRYANLILRMEEMGIRYSIIEASRKLGDFLIVVGLFLIISPSHTNFIIGYIISLYLAASLSLLMSLNFWKKNNIEKEVLSNSLLGHTNKNKIISYSIPFLFSNLLLVLFQTLDKIILGYWSTAREVGMYSASMKMIMLLSVIQYVFSLYWTSFYLKKYEKNPHETKVFTKVTRLLFFVMTLLVIFIILFRNYLILFLGEEYQTSTNLIAILVFIPFFVTITEATGIGINIKMKTKYHTYVMVVVIIIFIISSNILTANFGSIGMAISMTFSYLVFFISKTCISQKLFKIEMNYSSISLILGLLFIWLVLIIRYNIILVDYIFACLLITILCLHFFKDYKALVKTIWAKVRGKYDK